MGGKEPDTRTIEISASALALLCAAGRAVMGSAPADRTTSMNYIMLRIAVDKAEQALGLKPVSQEPAPPPSKG